MIWMVDVGRCKPTLVLVRVQFARFSIIITEVNSIRRMSLYPSDKIGHGGMSNINGCRQITLKLR